jgi:hypothetical protein
VPILRESAECFEVVYLVCQYIQEGVKDGKLTLEHVAKYNAEVEKAGITDGRVAPAIIPDYTEAEVRSRQLTSNYVGRDESFRKPSEQILRVESRPGKGGHHPEASLAWRSGNRRCEA